MKNTFILIEVVEILAGVIPVTIGRQYLASVNGQYRGGPVMRVYFDDNGKQGNLFPKEYKEIAIVRLRPKPAKMKPSPVSLAKNVAQLDNCKECKRPSSILHDYNGHGHYVCIGCLETLEKEFEEEYR